MSDLEVSQNQDWGRQPRPLIVKLSEVMQTVGVIVKTGRNEVQGYNYAREADIVQAIRGELAVRKVMVIPDVEEVITIERKGPDGKDRSPLTRVKVSWLMVDGESGDTLVVTAFGDGMDAGDKGYYKAMTGCQKYLWMKMLHLPTYDDPEADTTKGVQKARQAAKDVKTAPTRPSDATGATDGIKAKQRQFFAVLHQLVKAGVYDEAIVADDAIGKGMRRGLYRDLLKMPEPWVPDVEKMTEEDWQKLVDAIYLLRDDKVPQVRRV